MYRQSLCGNFERKSSLGVNSTDNGYAHSSIAEDSNQRMKNIYMRNGSIGEHDDDTESVISLMSCQSIAPSIQQHQSRIISPTYASQLRKSPNMGGTGLNMIPENTLRRNDFKRHSLSSLRKIQGGGNLRGASQTNQREPSIGSRNSIARRSLINPRLNMNRMSAIEEFSGMLIYIYLTYWNLYFRTYSFFTIS